MKKYTQVPPILIARAISLAVRGRVRLDKAIIGTTLKEDEVYTVFRKIVVHPKRKNQAPAPGAQFRVYFRFARFSVKANKILSLIPIPFITAQPGFRSKTWLTGKDTGTFQGLYEWDQVEDAQKYWNSFPMKLMKGRSVPETLRYDIQELNDQKASDLKD